MARSVCGGGECHPGGLGERAKAIEHIGSTSVPGLAAKPILDIMIGVAGELVAGLVDDALVRLGYDALGEAGVPGRLYFRKRGPVSVNVHVVVFGGSHWHNNLAIRDYLRTHPEEVAEYAEHKRQVIAGGGSTLLAYSERKAGFVAALLERARGWVS
jgi:GrpB-like predicted nucleotidyltransferase (UPF0157 family)